MSNLVPHWLDDPQRAAPTIRCEVCVCCHWSNPQQHGLCIYAGPFTGYEMPDGAIESVTPKKPLES